MNVDRSLTLSLGPPETPNSGWNLLVSATQSESVVNVAMHWNDKTQPTHYWNVSVDLLEELVRFARTGQTQKEN